MLLYEFNQGSNNVRSDIINEVLTVEDRAQKIIRDSERTVRDYITDAQTEANEIVRSSLKQERERCQALLQQAEADAALQLSEFEAGLTRVETLQEDTLDRIAQAIVEKVCNTDLASYLVLQ
jgi:vacuolar-type H+-ATPase subunit H